MPRKDRNVVGPEVRRLRSQRELSQADLAVQLQLAGLDWSRVSLAKIESRIKKVSDAELFILAEVLGVGMEELFPNGKIVKRFLESKD
jgi:transcriptional regulator with XRE-family HTH domain